MKVYIHTLGCKVNQYESQAVSELLIKQGHTIVTQPNQADAFVINSCTVTAESDKKTKKTIRRLRNLNPKGIIIVTGCMTQAFPSQAANLEADIIIGNKGYSQLPYLLDEFVKTHRKILSIQPHMSGDEFEISQISRFNERTRAYLKIEDGCNRFCSYCIIPTARGRVRSKPIDCIREEAQKLAESGFCEIVL
ncbi:MAG: tRNA (N(6)-L-threonylcarbamoyladenosine(37)-C(2))-methylthiotransferase MtaB, partial [bacterium]|nr:tRNA (N(6)-L-threonylcarbamoyladenosine(37)-C(2))-methylthiotransferase MtaB [bacterium]